MDQHLQRIQDEVDQLQHDIAEAKNRGEKTELREWALADYIWRKEHMPESIHFA